MDVLHSAIWISDIEETLAFYVDALGFEEIREFESGEGAQNVFVAGESDTEIQFKYDPDGDRSDLAVGGYDHVAIAVDDTDAEVDRLVEATGCPLRRGPLTSDGANARVAFVEDPDGYGVELVEEFD